MPRLKPDTTGHKTNTFMPKHATFNGGNAIGKFTVNQSPMDTWSTPNVGPNKPMWPTPLFNKRGSYR